MLLTLIKVDNDATDAEIAARFTAATGCCLSTRTVNRMWRRLGVTRRKRRSAPASKPERPGQIVLLDNLSAHKRSRIEALVGKAGAEVLWLPRYSPEYNAIEQAWSKLKGLLRT